MSATNKTAIYELPIFLGTDVPSWLTDWNGAMGVIDNAIAAAKAAADAAASTAGTAAADIVTIQGNITSLQGTVGTHTTQISTISGAINTINSLIGNGTPTTTDQTLIGAVNEINAYIKATTLGSQTVISGTSQSDPYTFPTDGYLEASANSSAVQCEVVIMGSAGVPQGLRLKAVYDANAGTGLNIIFVRKGMKCYQSSQNGSVAFYSLT